jgi:hypothetical protein
MCLATDRVQEGLIFDNFAIFCHYSILHGISTQWITWIGFVGGSFEAPAI